MISNKITGRVGYVGAFGVGNRGDDYLIQAFAAERMPALLIGFSPLPFMSDIPFMLLDDAAGLSDIAADDITICGGNFIWSVDQLNKVLAIAHKIKAAGGQFNIRCVHVTSETVWAAPSTFIELANIAHHFSVRDHASIELCADFGISVEFEQDALAKYVAANFNHFPQGRSVQRVGFNFHNWGPESIDWYFEFLGTLNHLAPHNLELTYILQCRHLTHPPSNEAALAEHLFSRFTGKIEITRNDGSLDELINHYCAQDLIISNRTHGVFIGEALGIRTVPGGIGDQKTLAVARDLKLPVFMLKENPIEAGRRLASRLW
ncbi:hypothetical protein A6U85_23860 [Agrobacterium sp. 13-626]|jgi:polysaccharide pyruvyl transferase WcaK-like protein|uniref:polysaccharide pyruvyl transferase family protein n=1 Tax=Rhizobium rhizogenes TaxID=359 RepID=UPI0008100D51|nr:polysaccharide pyruvyl transferase family protein [Rhizobium rhizogenes]NTH79014.1 hypothetical protein [Rhizobium rhizogenes]NTH85019.1 hypothetical protein [Rhizobium rhizogenes]OCI91412.1 hypothetical protein A6U85_23860 [Agrobacterium sp. 13-626]